MVSLGFFSGFFCCFFFYFSIVFLIHLKLWTFLKFVYFSNSRTFFQILDFFFQNHKQFSNVWPFLETVNNFKFLNSIWNPRTIFKLVKKIKIRENESLFNIKTTCYDVFCIFTCKPFAFVNSQILPQELLIISELYYQWHLKSILQISEERFLWSMSIANGYLHNQNWDDNARFIK